MFLLILIGETECLCNMRYTDVMIDIETTGRTPGCAIIQIAAVPFNINTGAISTNVFKMSINLESQKKVGYYLDSNTIGWWRKENLKLFKELSESNNHFINVAIQFQRWFKNLENYKNIRTWGNSSRFDLGILEKWYQDGIRKNKFQPFWNTWLERDVRTLAMLDPQIKANTKFEGVKHNAIDDCKHQIKYCRAIVRKYKLKIN